MPIRSSFRRVVVLTAAVGLLVGGLAGPAAARGAQKHKDVEVELTSDGCPKSIATKAGPITFTVTNDGADNVSEFEILKGGRILGEVENVAPGLTRSFTRTLEAGEYTTYCPGGDAREKGKLVVKGATGTAGAPPRGVRRGGRVGETLLG